MGSGTGVEARGPLRCSQLLVPFLAYRHRAVTEQTKQAGYSFAKRKRRSPMLRPPAGHQMHQAAHAGARGCGKLVSSRHTTQHVVAENKADPAGTVGMEQC